MPILRNFTFASLHAARDATVTNITASEAAAAGFPLDNLIDDRRSTLHKFQTSPASQWIKIFRPVANSFNPISRLIVPEGHNWSGTVTIESATTDSFPGTSRLVLVATAGVMIDLPVTESTDAWWRVVWTSAGTVWETPQLVLTATRTMIVGADLANSTDELVSNSRQFTKDNGMSPAIALGPSQRRFELPFRSIQGNDLITMDAMIEEVGTHRPFWVQPGVYTHFTTLATATNDTEDNVNKNVDLSMDDWPEAGGFLVFWQTELMVCQIISSTVIKILTSGRGGPGTDAVAHNVGEVITLFTTDTTVRSSAEATRWMKFEDDPSGRLEPFIVGAGRYTKSYDLALRDHLD